MRGQRAVARDNAHRDYCLRLVQPLLDELQLRVKLHYTPISPSASPEQVEELRREWNRQWYTVAASPALGVAPESLRQAFRNLLVRDKEVRTETCQAIERSLARRADDPFSADNPS